MKHSDRAQGVNNFVGRALIVTFILDDWINRDEIASRHFNGAERKCRFKNTNRNPAQRLSLISVFALQLTAKREFPQDVPSDSSYTRQDRGEIKVSQGKRNTRCELKKLLNFRLET